MSTKLEVGKTYISNEGYVFTVCEIVPSRRQEVCIKFAHLPLAHRTWQNKEWLEMNSKPYEPVEPIWPDNSPITTELFTKEDMKAAFMSMGMYAPNGIAEHERPVPFETWLKEYKKRKNYSDGI